MIEPVVKGQQAVADHFAVSDRTVRNWIKDGMPKRPGGRYDLPEIQRWLDAREGLPFGRPPGSGQPDDPRQGTLADGSGKSYQEERFKKFKANLAELEYRQRVGELIEVRELEALLTPRAMAYRQGLVAFEQLLSPKLAGALGLPPESMRLMNVIIRQVTREVLAKVLRALHLQSGQMLEWEKEPGARKEAQGGG